MHDDSVLVAVEDATRTPRFCICGKYLALVQTHDAMWLECPTYTAPTRLPAAVASVVRFVLHDRELVVQIPEALRTPAAPVKVAGAKGSTPQVSAAHA